MNYFKFLNQVVFPMVEKSLSEVECYPCALDGDSGITINGNYNERKIVICIWTYGFTILIQPYDERHKYENYSPNTQENFIREFTNMNRDCYERR